MKASRSIHAPSWRVSKKSSPVRASMKSPLATTKASTKRWLIARSCASASGGEGRGAADALPVARPARTNRDVVSKEARMDRSAVARTGSRMGAPRRHACQQRPRHFARGLGVDALLSDQIGGVDLQDFVVGT